MKELRKITQEQLEEILHKHKLWLEGEEGGEKADLSYCDLRDANLTGANLTSANLEGANLKYAYLEYANLVEANLEGADLKYVNLKGAILEGANLEGADLKSAWLEDTILKKANLNNTILQVLEVLETNSIDLNKVFNEVFDTLEYATENKNVNEIIITEDKIEIEIKNKNH